MSLDFEGQMALLHTAVSGNRREREGAFAQLLNDFRPYALAVIHRTLAAASVGSEHAEEALLQASFKFYFVGLEHFRHQASPRSYFVKIALCAAIDVVRELKRRARMESNAHAADVSSTAYEASPEMQILIAEERSSKNLKLATLRHCFDELNESYRLPVKMYYLDRYGRCEECARKLGISKQAFEKRLSRARERLASCMAQKLKGLEFH